MHTIGDILAFLLETRPTAKSIVWPPDAFALCGALLDRSGAYLEVVTKWPPKNARGNWTTHVADIGLSWRNLAPRGKAPKAILTAWHDIRSHADLKIHTLRSSSKKSRKVSDALMLIFAAADACCDGVGILYELNNNEHTIDAFEEEIFRLLHKQAERKKSATLCKKVRPSSLSVLPKMHTPQTGITLRSLSHHLAICCTPDIKLGWLWSNYSKLNGRHGLNILVVPWPLEIKPTAFSPNNPPNGALENLPSNYGFFNYNVRNGNRFDVPALRRTILQAISEVGDIDLIVLPELALAASDLLPIFKMIDQLEKKPLFVSGVGFPAAKKGEATRNASLNIIPQGQNQDLSAFLQAKHHRWLLNESQICQYGLGSRLNPSVCWWENSELNQRELHFVSLQPWLTLCTLICEDLARPDPIANAVRSVGPNLIIALLMDGPQLKSRWSARYGAALADDPGSSVLTVSPLGMVRLSRPPETQSSNVVALWKDALSPSAVELTLPEGKEAIILSLVHNWREEYTADGRNDEGSTVYLTLAGVHPI